MLESLQWSYLKEIFFSVEHWSEKVNYYERATWIAVKGIPLHCWNFENKKRIAEIWGTFESLGENAFHSIDCETVTILLTTKQIKKIEDCLEIEVGDQLFTVRVSELGFSDSSGDCWKRDSKKVGDAEKMFSDSESISEESEKFSKEVVDNLDLAGTVMVDGDRRTSDVEQIALDSFWVDRQLNYYDLGVNDFSRVRGFEGELMSGASLQYKSIEFSQVNVSINGEVGNLGSLNSNKEMFAYNSNKSYGVDPIQNFSLNESKVGLEYSGVDPNQDIFIEAPTSMLPIEVFGEAIRTVPSCSKEPSYVDISLSGDSKKSKSKERETKVDSGICIHKAWTNSLNAQINEGAIIDSEIDKEDLVIGENDCDLSLELEDRKRKNCGAKKKKYGSMLDLQSRVISDKERKKRDKALRRRSLEDSFLENSELSGKSLSDSDIKAKVSSMVKEAKQVIDMGKLIGVSIVGNEDEVVQELIVIEYNNRVLAEKV
ncbi:hypothetical protein GQ457_15G020430 [Hibiscus cannabinus]